MSKVTVLGGNGGTGQAIVAELAARGYEVSSVSRSGGGANGQRVRTMPADLLDRRQAVAACAGADVVVMAAHVPYRQWAAALVPMVEHAMAGAELAGARLVMVDNLYAYGAPDGPISEATPESATSRKGALRRRIGELLLEAHRADRLGVTIGRCSDYYGPGGTNSAVYQLGIARALRGKAVRALIDADQPRSFHYLPDAARGFAELVARPDADGRVWILPAAPPTTQRELLGLVASAAGAPGKVGRVSKPMLALAGLANPDLRELLELSGQWDRPYTIDASAFEAAFGAVELTPHEQAVEATVAAFRREAVPAV